MCLPFITVVFRSGVFAEFFHKKTLNDLLQPVFDDAKKIVDRCIECNYSILCIDDELFPKCLYNIECPPALIYINGVMPDIDNTFSIRYCRYSQSN